MQAHLNSTCLGEPRKTDTLSSLAVEGQVLPFRRRPEACCRYGSRGVLMEVRQDADLLENWIVYGQDAG